MLGELPKLFDRDFVIAFFIPSLIFVIVSFAIFTMEGLAPQLLLALSSDWLQVVTIAGLICWCGGVILLTVNYHVYRVLEGYGTFNPLRLLKFIQVLRLNRIKREIAGLEKLLSTSQEKGEKSDLTKTYIRKRSKLEQTRVEQFSALGRQILPTAFGNTIKAFEDYAPLMYGVDSVIVWDRLIAVIPQEYRGLVNAAKAQTDFWLNLWLLSLIAMIEFICLALYKNFSVMYWLPMAIGCLAFVAASMARKTAVEWGGYVKASFDLFLPDLYAKLLFPKPANMEEERETWHRFSRAVIYHRPSDLVDRSYTQAQGGGNKTGAT